MKYNYFLAQMFIKKKSIITNIAGVTLLEILTVVAAIGILSAVAIPQYNQYKIKGYDAHTKQALRDVNSLCSAYWLENVASAACDLSIIKDSLYGFSQNSEVEVVLTPSTFENFCVSAKHQRSPNLYSIDTKSLIISGESCAGRIISKPDKPVDDKKGDSPVDKPSNKTIPFVKPITVNLEEKELTGCVKQCVDSTGCGNNCIQSYMGSYRGPFQKCYQKCQNFDGYRLSKQQYENTKQLPYYARSIATEMCMQMHLTCGSDAGSTNKDAGITSFRVDGKPASRYEWANCQDLPASCDLEPEGPLNPSGSDCSEKFDSDNHLVAYSRSGEDSFPCNSKPKLTSICSQPGFVYLKVCEGVPLDKDRLEYQCQSKFKRWENIPELVNYIPAVCKGEGPGISLEINKSISERLNLKKNPFYNHEATFEGLVWGGKSIELRR